jgi:hypothetical protein
MFTLSFAAMGASTASATETVCLERQWKLYHYGVKAEMRLKAPKPNPDAITDAIKEYALKNGLTYSSVGGFDPYEKPPHKDLTQILQSPSYDVSITVETTNRDSIARVEVSTFSYSCGKTEDWKPYWRAFERFVLAGQYQRISN